MKLRFWFDLVSPLDAYTRSLMCESTLIVRSYEDRCFNFFVVVAGVMVSVVINMAPVVLALVIKSQICLKAAEAIFPLRSRYQSPRLLQISTNPVLALALRSCCPSPRKNTIIYAILAYSLDLIFSSFFITMSVFKNASLMG